MTNRRAGRAVRSQRPASAPSVPGASSARRLKRHAVVLLTLIVTALVAVVGNPARAGTTTSVDVTVSAASDDAEERTNGSVSRNSSDLELVFDQGGNQVVGIRFGSVPVPAGATITDAYLQLTADETNAGTVALVIRGEAADAADPYTSAAFGISSRSTTPESVDWAPADWNTVGEAGAAQRTPDLSALVQAITGRPGWTQGGPVAFVITGTGERTAESFNGSAQAAPRLHVEYELAGVVVSSFSATPADPQVDEAVGFSWAVADSDGAPVSCTLDVDDGSPDYVIPDCADVTTQAHTYSSPGSRTARLVATSSTGSDSATLSLTVADPNGLVFEQRISAGSDDAEQRANGSVSLNSSDLELVFDQGGDQTVGLRFGAVTVPPGATITNAYVQFGSDEINSGTTNLTIRGQATDAAPTFSGTANEISNRPTTAAAVAWTPPAWTSVGLTGPDQRTPDIASVVQEVVDRGGWSSGNPLALIISGTGERTAEAFNGNSSLAPLLHIEYTASGLVISGLAANPSEPSVGEVVVFSWSVTDGDGNPVSCELDVDDDGTVDYAIPDCLGTTTQAHTYLTAGSKTARLNASSAGHSATRTTGVIVSDGSATIVETRVVGSESDAEEGSDGSVSRSSSDLELVYDRNGNQTVAVRFGALEVPPLATITAAWVQFTTDEVTTGPTNLMIHGEDADSSATYSSTAFDISSRPLTAASTTWAPTGWSTVGEAGAAQRTPDLSGIVQEIVERPGWEQGRALSLVITGTGERTAESYDGDPTAAPLLHVEFRQGVVVGSFSSAPTHPPPNQPVTFSWTVSDPDGDAVSCALDVDGDGSPDYLIADCIGTTTQDHTYPDEGFNTARLTATDDTGAAATATTIVNVLDPQTAVVAAAGDIACDPTSSSFNGGAGTSSNCRMLATSDLVLGMSPNAVLLLGDNQYEDGTLSQFNQSYDLSWGRFKEITYPAVGNHEYKTLGASGYYSYFGPAAGDPAKGYYSTNIGNWHVVALNSNCSKAGGCSAGTPQEQWLRADLAAHPAVCTLAFWHHPLFSSGAIGDIAWTRDIWQALDEGGADVVLVGHDHHYERFARQDADGNADASGIREFIVGTGGRNHTSLSTLKPNSEAANSNTYGVLKLTLRSTSYAWDFVPEPGKTFTDSGSTACS